MSLRLNRFLAQAGVSSRRSADSLVREGRVTVNGEPVRALGVRVDPAVDRVTVDGRPVRLETSTYWGAFHKPRGVLTTLCDPRGRPDLRAYLRGLPLRVYPVGRLDADSEGLLLLTNDGDLAYRLMHPRYQVEKEYVAEIRGRVPAGLPARLLAGVELEDGPARAVRAAFVERAASGAVLRLTLTEGRRREVRRMVEAAGLAVSRLVRVRMGCVELGELAPGRRRPLTREEVRGLRALVGGAAPAGAVARPVRDRER
jgi:23S rRNA pseudouridine2605 synthase